MANYDVTYLFIKTKDTYNNNANDAARKKNDILNGKQVDLSIQS